MQNSNQNTTHERGFFRRAFQEFDEQQFFQRLQERIQEQPYHRKNKGLKDTVLTLSYGLNLLSALSASYLIFWLTQWLAGLAILGYLIAAIFLFFLEKLKRKSSNEFFQVYFFQKRVAIGWLGLSLFCFALSVSSTYFGTDRGTRDFSPNATTLSADTTETGIRNQIALLEQEIENLKKERNHEGVIYFPTQQAIASNKSRIEALQNRLNEKETGRESDNKEIQKQHSLQVNLTATTLAWILVLLEVLFEACIAFIWYYYYRSFVEWKQTNPTSKVEKTATNEQFVHPSEIDNEHLLQMIQQLQNQLIHLRATPPPISPEQKNGQTTKIENSFKKPIGFFTDSQLAKMESDTKILKKSSVQPCTSLYRQTDFQSDDIYTIKHQYIRGEKTITVRYTEQQVRARLQQWQRDLEDAQKRNLDLAVIENRKAWVEYWGRKLLEFQKREIHLIDTN